jgi:uncharacterized protein YciI
MRFLVTTTRTPKFQTSAVEAHYAFLDALRAKQQLEIAGPFGDKSGGAYILKVDSLDEAKAIAFSDPIYTTGSSTLVIQEWNAR